MTERQERALEAICDTLGPDGLASSPGVPGAVVEAVEAQSNPTERKRVARLLALLESPLRGALVRRSLRPFSDLTPARRERILSGLARSGLAGRRVALAALRSAALGAYYTGSDRDRQNPLWPGLDYRALAGGPASEGPSIRPLEVAGDAQLDCDVVVVGSGAGGAVAAAVLTEAGLDVIVLEAGGYHDGEGLGGLEGSAYARLYLDRGAAASADRGIDLAAGSCLGGSTVIGFASCFQTPEAVREEWAAYADFTGADYQRSLDAVWERQEVNTHHSSPSARDRIMRRGLKTLGWHVATVPRSVRGCDPEVCGYCGFGCRSGAKRDALKPWLEDAVRQGARILVHTAVDRVTTRGGLATGVVAVFHHPTSDVRHLVTVRARVVVAACGALHTPALLARSGLQNRNIGRHLRLHPSTLVWGTSVEPVRPWEGTMQAIWSGEHADLRAGYGVRYETVPVHPGLMARSVPWASAAQHAARMRELPQTSVVRAAVRDRDGGEVRVTREGRPVVDYRLSAHDAAHLRAGIEGAARILEAAGATEVFSCHCRGASFRPSASESIEDLMRRADACGYAPGRIALQSLEPTGSCRMGPREATSVVDPEGCAHEVENLLVCDGSVLPSAPGVPPMVTIAALAHLNARRLAARLS